MDRHRITAICLLFLVISPFSGSMAEESKSSILVHFKDGEKIVVTNWNFEYEFGEEDEKGSSLFFAPKTKELKKLCIITDNRRGYAKELEIAAEQIKLIRFSWIQATDKKEFYVSLSGVTIEFKNGEILKFPEYQFQAGRKCLSEKKHVFGSSNCDGKPCLNLTGTVLIEKQTESFKKTLNPSWYFADPAEVIVQLQFIK